MVRLAVRVVVALTLVGLGWTAGKAQPFPPRIELVVEAPAGVTRVECRSGCDFGRSTSRMRTPQTMFTFSCPGSKRCSSEPIIGWVRD